MKILSDSMDKIKSLSNIVPLTIGILIIRDTLSLENIGTHQRFTEEFPLTSGVPSPRRCSFQGVRSGNLSTKFPVDLMVRLLIKQLRVSELKRTRLATTHTRYRPVINKAGPPPLIMFLFSPSPSPFPSLSYLRYRYFSLPDELTHDRAARLNQRYRLARFEFQISRPCGILEKRRHERVQSTDEPRPYLLSSSLLGI